MTSAENKPENFRWIKIQAQEKLTRAIIDRDFSASRMNTTKWREAVDCLSDLSVRFTVRFVHLDGGGDPGRFWHVTGDWFDSGVIGPFTSVSLEWLDIYPEDNVNKYAPWVLAACTVQGIAARLNSVNVQYEDHGEFLRVIGHVRNISSG